MKEAWSCKNSHPSNSVTEVFGGIIFTCSCRSGSFLGGGTNVDSSPFLENLPGVPLAGIICCGGEIGRLNSSSTNSAERQEESAPPLRCLLYYSTVYLVMSYTTLSPL